EGAVEVGLQLVQLAERGELRDGAQAPAPEVEVRPCPEASEHELGHQREEVRCEPLRRKPLPAGAGPPELSRNLTSPGHEVSRIGHRRDLLVDRAGCRTTTRSFSAGGI